MPQDGAAVAWMKPLARPSDSSSNDVATRIGGVVSSVKHPVAVSDDADNVRTIAPTLSNRLAIIPLPSTGSRLHLHDLEPYSCLWDSSVAIATNDVSQWSV